MKNRSTLIIKRPQIRTHSQVRLSERQWFLHEPTMNLTSHTAAWIYFCSRIPRRLYDRRDRNRSTQRTNARMRHTPSPSTNVYAECTRICSRIIKNTSVLFDQATAYRPTDERDGHYLWKRSGRRDARYNAASTLAVNRALSRKHTVEKRVGQIILTFVNVWLLPETICTEENLWLKRTGQTRFWLYHRILKIMIISIRIPVISAKILVNLTR